MIKWIGLTGTIGSGKSTVAELLRRRFFNVLDADEISKQVTAPGTPASVEIARTFGSSILDEKGIIDRRKLGDVVFKSAIELSRLEQIVHPRVVDIVLDYRAKLKDVDFAFYDVPLLFEKRMQEQFHAIVVITSPIELAMQRVKERSGGAIDKERFLARFNRQVSSHAKIKAANWVIDNDGSMKDLTKKVEKLIEDIKAKWTS